MGVIYSSGGCHLVGHKELTSGKPVKNLLTDKAVAKIYIPTVSANGKEITLNVNVGDQVKKGTLLGVGQGFYVPIFSSVSGKIVAKEKRFNSLVGRPIDHLVIENDYKYEVENTLTPYEFDKVFSGELVARIKDAGIVGLGGAGFPTYVKYGAKDIHTILINACECEPYLTTDHEMILSEIDLFMKGVSLLIKAADASNAIIAIKKGKADLKEAITGKLSEYPNITLKEVKDVYPAGWERTLIYSVFKKEYKNLPSEIGVIVNNAQTAIAVAKAVLLGQPITERVVTVSGAGVKEPQNVLVPVGTVVGEIINAIGGYASEEVFLLAGGPMCSKAQMNDQFVVEKQSGGYTVLPYTELKSEECLRCGACTMHCPAGLQPVEIKDAVAKKDEKRLNELQANSCVECGMCSFICPSRIDVTENIRKAKLMLRIAAMKAAPKK